MKLIIAYRVLVALGVVLFLIGLVNLFYDWQLDGVQLLSVLLASGGIVCTGFASIMVDHCKIRAKTALLVEQASVVRRFNEIGNNEEAMPKSFPSGFISPDWERVLNDYKINTAVALTDEEKDQQHLAHLIRKGEKGFNQ